MKNDMKSSGIKDEKDKVTLILIDGAGHGGEQFETKENLDKTYSFLDKYMK